MESLVMIFGVAAGAALALVGIGVLFFYYAFLRALVEFYHKK